MVSPKAVLQEKATEFDLTTLKFEIKITISILKRQHEENEQAAYQLGKCPCKCIHIEDKYQEGIIKEA